MQKIASRRAKFWVLKLIGKIGLLTYGKQYRAGEITFDDLFDSLQEWNQTAITNYLTENPERARDIIKMGDFIANN